MLVLSPVGGAVLAVAQAAGWDVSLSAGWPDRLCCLAIRKKSAKAIR